MKNSKRWVSLAMLVLGIVMILIGGFVFDREEQKQQSGIMIGVGAGLLGISISGLVTAAIYAKDPSAKRRAEIDEKDERNIALSNRAKGKAFDAMGPILGTLMLVLVLMDTPLPAVLLLVGAYMLVNGYYVVALHRLAKLM